MFRNTENLKEIALKSSKAFNFGQIKAFDIFLNEVLPNFMAEDPAASVHWLLNYDCLPSRAYLLNELEETRNTFNIRAI